MREKKKLVISILGVILLVIAVVSISYAAFNYSKTGQTINSITTSTIVMNYTEKENGINLVNAMPMEDENGKVLTGSGNVFDFTVSANISGETVINYAITGSKVEGTTLPDSAVKVWLTSADDAIIELDGVSSLNDDAKKISELNVTNNDVSGAPNDQYILNRGVITSTGITNYRLRMWIASDYSLKQDQVETYKLRVNVYGSTEKEPKIAETMTGVDALLTYYTNDENVQDYDMNHLKNSIVAKENKMYVFNHEEASQQSGWSSEQLKDYRYIGKDPNNYVTFNNEEAGWRIIGIETVDNGNGVKEKRIKLIRKDPLTPYMVWDNKSSGIGSSELSSGSNDWTDSRLMMMLNPGYDDEANATGGKGSIYWNQQKGKCGNGSSDHSVSCDFTNTGLTKDAQQMIGDTKWYLGTINGLNFQKSDGGTAAHWYSYERGTTILQNELHPRKTNWTGRVGLLYPSDYGYATSGGSTMDRNACLAKEIFNWTTSTDCFENDWLYNSNNSQWTITPNISNTSNVFYIGKTGQVNGGMLGSNTYIVRPVVYLKGSVKITGGTGSVHSPFTLSYQSTAVEKLLSDYTNGEEVQDFNINYSKEDSSAKENKMYVFNHKDTKGTQQSDWSDDELKDYRYMGANPNNYVTFNNETAGWRIIGIETVDDGSGKREKRVKLVRKDALEPNMVFDNKPKGTGSAETGNGSNDWQDARVMMLLNPNYENNQFAAGGKGSLYWNRQEGSCGNGGSNSVTSCSFTDNGLLPEAQKMIGDAKWFLGGSDTKYITMDEFYKAERSETIYQSVSYPRKTNWTGRVGLMYPTDYGFATSGTDISNRQTCKGSGADLSMSDCYNNNWLYNGGLSEWTMTPSPSNSYYIYNLRRGGFDADYSVDYAYRVRPVVYLNADIKYLSGNGSISAPFEFVLPE